MWSTSTVLFTRINQNTQLITRFLICGSAMLPYLFFHEMDIAKLEMLKSE